MFARTTTLALAAISAAILLAAAQPAQAFDLGEERATDGLLIEAVHKADEFWATKGYGQRVRERPATVLVMDEPRDSEETRQGLVVAARAEQPGVRVWFDRRFVRDMRKLIAELPRNEFDRQGAFESRRNGYLMLLMVAIHERGHNLGFRHEDRKIMGENPKSPGIALDWAREKAARR